MRKFQTVSTVNPTYGSKFTYAEFGGGLTGYPGDAGSNTYLAAWAWDEVSLSDADLATRVNHYISNYGMLYSFQFTDPDDFVAYNHVRYSSDEFTVDYAGVGDARVSIALEQTYLS
jgi:hypothetical protein